MEDVAQETLEAVKILLSEVCDAALRLAFPSDC